MKKILFTVGFVIYFSLFLGISRADWVDGLYVYNTSGVYSTDEYFALAFKTAIKELARQHQHRFQVLLYNGPLDSDDPKTSARVEIMLDINCDDVPALNVDFEVWRPSKPPGEEPPIDHTIKAFEGTTGPAPGVAWRPAFVHFLAECGKVRWKKIDEVFFRDKIVKTFLMKEALGSPYGPKEGSGKKGKGWIHLKIGGLPVNLFHHYELDQGFIKFDSKWYYQKECQMYQ